MVSKITFLVGGSLYQAKRHFTYRLAEACERVGIESHVMELPEMKISEDLVAKIIKQNPDITCSFTHITPIPGRKSLWDIINIPHLTCLLDPSILDMYLTKSSYSILSCVDRYDCEFLEHAKFNRTFYFPLAVEKEVVEEVLEENRPYDVVFFGSCYDHEGLRQSWEKNYEKPVCAVIEKTIDRTIHDPKMHFVDALIKEWDEAKLSSKGVDFTSICDYIDKYLRGVERYELISAIQDIPIHVFGALYWNEAGRLKSWPHYLSQQENVTVHPAVLFDKSLEIMRKSKVVLGGSHGRVFSGLASGCAVITSENQYLQEEFSLEEGVYFYPVSDRNIGVKAIKEALVDEEKRLVQVERGRAKVKNRHTWDNRALLLQEMLPEMLRM